MKTLITLLASGNIPKGSTQHLLLESTINFAKTDLDIDVVNKWYQNDVVSDLAGNELRDVEISNKHRHSMVRRIYSSETIPEQVKKDALEKLAEKDSSDWMDKTRYYCKAAVPTKENKDAMWREYFDTEFEWQYANYSMSFNGFN